jgi:hypothetical protein
MRQLLLIGMLTLCGCSSGESATAVPIDKLPPGYLDKAKEFAKSEYSDVEFNAAGKKADGTYEIQGRARNKNGKTVKIEVEIDKNGKATFD